MTRTELLELIANGENSGVEFKRDDIRAEQFAKEVVALLNLQGVFSWGSRMMAPSPACKGLIDKSGY